MPRITYTLFALVFSVSCASAAAAQERAISNFAGLGVRAMSMGGAYVGVADDFTAVFWNPAGLAQMRQRQGYVAVIHNTYDNNARKAGNPLTTSEMSNTRIGSLGLVYPYPVYRGSLVFGAGFNQVKDFDSIIRIRGFSQVDSLQVDDTFSHEGDLTMVSLAGAIDISPSIALGLTLNFLSGEDENIRDYNWIDSEDYFIESRWSARDEFDDDYNTAFGATLGAMMRTPREDPRVRFGATISPGPTYKIDYSFAQAMADEDGVPGYNSIEYDDGREPETTRNVVDTGSYRLSLPLQFGAGLSCQPVKGLWLAGSAHVAGWSQSEYKGEDEYGVRANAAFEEQYEDVVRYHLGVEWQVPVITLDLRAGYYSDPWPFVGPRDPDLSPNPATNPLISIVRDRRYLTLGAGMLFDEVMQVDAAWTRGRFELIEGDLSEETVLSRLFASASYRF